MRELEVYRDAYNTAKARRSVHLEQLAKAKADKAKYEVLLATLEQAKVYIQTKAVETQSQLSIKVEDLVQLGIDAVFPDKFKFKLLFETKRGRTEARAQLLDGEWEVNPFDDCGGGVANLEAFGLRMASWSLSPTRPTIWLDEPFKDVNGETEKKAACAALQEISHRLGIQFIIITGDPKIVEVADRVIEVDQKSKTFNVCGKKVRYDVSYTRVSG